MPLFRPAPSDACVRRNALSDRRFAGSLGAAMQSVVRGAKAAVGAVEREQKEIAEGNDWAVTDKTRTFFLEVVRKRPQDSAGHHALVHPISPSVGCDGGLP
ncbi:hypothetical protein KM043_003625 [Ampulex compressa]|nr:hypothetical protein KM043_003625 [Ampulex compressa]